MSFTKKTWKNRESANPIRRKLIRADTGTETIYDVERYEGIVTEEGDDFSAENMNDLEGRIKDGFDTIIPYSHIGQIIESTTLDTEAKVKAIYGSNTTWIQHTGYILRGANSNVTSNDNANTGNGFGGSDTETLTGAQSGLKGHGHSFTQPTVNGGATNTGWISADHSHVVNGGSHQHKSYYAAGGAYGGGYRSVTSDQSSAQSSYDVTWGDSSHTHAVSGVTANHYHGVPDHTHTVSGGAVTDASASNATSAHSTVQRYKNVYIWERTA